MALWRQYRAVPHLYKGPKWYYLYCPRESPMADKTADAIKLNLRLPPALHKRLKQQARRNNVSLNTEIVNQLEGAETSMAKRMAEIMKPLFNEAIEDAIAAATGR